MTFLCRRIAIQPGYHYKKTTMQITFVIVISIFRIFSQFPQSRKEIFALKRQGETASEETPIFDQHLSFLYNLPLTVWLPPLAISAIGVYYKDALYEQFELVFGVVSNIYNSIQGNFNSFIYLSNFLNTKNNAYKLNKNTENFDIYFSVTISAVLRPYIEILSPITDLAFGPSRSSESTYQKIITTPMFGPLTTCFFSRTHAPFTIVLNAIESDDGFSDAMAEIVRVVYSSYTGPTTQPIVGRSLQDGKY